MSQSLTPNIISIIPAHGNSKEIPKKNLIDFCGKPLLSWSIQQARRSKKILEVYVTSDDDEILSVAHQYGARLIKRPTELSTDTATSTSALLHALDTIQSDGTNIDLVVFLQVNSPLREAKDIDGAIEMLYKEQADSLFSSVKLKDFIIWEKMEKGFKSLNYDFQRCLRHRDVKPQYMENGSIYIFKPEVLRTYNNRLGGCIATYEMDFWQTWEINSLEDKALCEWFFENRILRKLYSLSVNQIDLIVYDFDGVMTDNRVLTLADGTEGVLANRADGLAVNLIKDTGISQIILSTEANPVVKVRAAKIGLPVLFNISDKAETLRSYCLVNGYDLSRVVYIGNDANDLEAMRSVGMAIAPADAHACIKRVAHMVLKSPGGHGVIRELADTIL
jgi:N-acylneuraminate cytidylyltransferase